jgi:hypothetical protein
MYMGRSQPVQTPFATAIAARQQLPIRAVNTPLLPRPGYTTVPTPSKVAAAFRYTSYYPQTPMRLPNMLATGMNGFGDAWHARSFPMGASNLPAAAASTASGASIGTAIFPGVGTAIGALLGMGVGLFSGKAHYSPWNFLYDDYPQHIYEAENAIVSLKNALARYTGQPQLPAPPMYSKTGGPQYQASMQAIVPQYVPGSQAAIAKYDRKLNEAGGAYENTLKQQLAIIPQLQQALQSAQSSGAPIVPSVPASGSATAPAPYGGPGSPQLIAPPGMPQLTPGPSMLPYTMGPQNISPGAGYSLSPTYNAPAGIVTSDMFGSMGPYMPYILGGVGLLVMLMQGQGGGTRTVYRSRPRRR